LKLTNTKSKENFYFAVKPSSQRVYSIALDISTYREYFANASGTYEVSLIVGDSFIEKSFIFKVGEVELKFEGKDERKIVDPFGQKPGIEHKFRKPEKEADTFITNLFCYILAVPFLYFLIQIVRFGNLSAFPDGLTAIFAILFFFSMSSLLSLFVYYWLELKLVETLYYAALISIPTVYTGKQVLSYMAQTRGGEKIKKE